MRGRPPRYSRLESPRLIDLTSSARYSSAERLVRERQRLRRIPGGCRRTASTRFEQAWSASCCASSSTRVTVAAGQPGVPPPACLRAGQRGRDVPSTLAAVLSDLPIGCGVGADTSAGGHSSRVRAVAVVGLFGEFTPAQADAITNAVRLAAEHGNHVTSDEFKVGLAELRTEMAALNARLSTQIANVETRLGSSQGLFVGLL